MKKELSYRQWFKENLPKDIATKAIANTPPILLDTKAPCFLNPLETAFTWCETKEGKEYWQKWVSKTENTQDGES